MASARVPASVQRRMAAIDWTPTIGDPTIVGWLTVVAYLVTGWLCLRALQTEKAPPPRPLHKTVPAIFRVLVKRWPSPPAPARRAAVWLVIAAIMFGLGINKQFDFQTLLTEIGRDLARDGGWYHLRRHVQVAFIIVVLILGLAGLAAMLWLTRGNLRDLRLPLLGLTLVGMFVVIRATSFQKVDILIKMDFAGIRMNWLLELGGIAIIAAGAIVRLRAAKASHP